MKLSEIVKKYREEHRLSQRTFAKKCDLSNGYISMIEKEKNYSTNKKVNITLDSMQKIAKGMSMTLDELLTITDDMNVSFEPRTNYADLSEKEIEIISVYRNNPQIKKIIDAAVGLSDQPTLNDSNTLKSAMENPIVLEKVLN